jgi:5-methylphenazine-1-carboxylate 1-monooxygenase
MLNAEARVLCHIGLRSWSTCLKVIIIGGSIAGLATALSLHAAGIEAVVFEQSAQIRELGVGINILPHAIEVLSSLGLLDALDEAGVRTEELIYMNRLGSRIWHELRGMGAGFSVPQFSIHRGKLQSVLRDAAVARLGKSAIQTGHRLTGFTQSPQGVTASLKQGVHATPVLFDADVLVGCDGIHSTIRAHYYPNEGPPAWNGVMLWRGAAFWRPFLTGRSMVIAGGMQAKLVVYPIHKDPARPGEVLMNWAVAAKTGIGGHPPRREDWSRPGQLAELLPFVEGMFSLSELDPLALVRATPEFYEYPMCDREPLPRWSHNRITLLGDAAHPMYPVGSNGASQAILDGQCLAEALAASPNDPVRALQYYETERLGKTTEIVRSNRLGGPERVIDLIEQRAPGGFSRIEEVASHEELRAIVGGYAQTAGFAPPQSRTEPPLAPKAQPSPEGGHLGS